MAGDAANALGDVDVAVAAAHRGENNFDDHLLEFKNSLLAASAESGYVLNCVNSLNSFACHPSMHAPSLSHTHTCGRELWGWWDWWWCGSLWWFGCEWHCTYG